MEIITREAARVAGLNRFFTGVPCKHGHIAPRRALNGACLACSAAGSKKRHTRKQAEDPEYVASNRARVNEWRLANLERHAESNRQWAQANKERKAETDAAYWAANRSEINARRRAKLATDPDIHKRANKRRKADPAYRLAARQRTARWKAAHPDRLVGAYARRKAANPEGVKASEAAAYMNRRARKITTGKVTAADVRAIRSRKRCANCRTKRGPFEIDHRIPLSRGGPHTRANLELLCRPCNRTKSAKDPIDWARENGRLL